MINLKAWLAGLAISSAAIFLTNSVQASVELVQSDPVETSLGVPGVPSTQSVWLELIQSAKSSIDMEEFYLSNQAGSALAPVISALQAAAGRGVKIRVLVDAKFYGTYSTDANALSKVPNIALKTIDFSKTGGVMHAKYFVVDQAQAYLGSANFDWLALSHIHEIGVKVVDAGISAQLESVFEQDWQASSIHAQQAPAQQAPAQQVHAQQVHAQQVHAQQTITKPQTKLGAGFYASPSVANPAGISASLDGLLSMINSATRSLKVQNYEYTTSVYHSQAHWTVLDSAIRAAAARGVQVELMLDVNALKAGSADLQALAGVKNIVIKMIKIPAWSGGPLAFARLAHSKYCVADDQIAWVGSENWSLGYFESSRNVSLIFKDAQPVNDLVQVFQQIWMSAYVSGLK